MIVQSKAPVRIDFAGGWTDVDIFAKGSGGAVVNAAINKYVTGKMEIYDTVPMQSPEGREGICVSYESELPSGSGLGTSSALNVVWLSLIKSRITSDKDREMIAELAYSLERMLGILGGKQDQYASALGGINFMTFNDSVKVEQIDVPPEALKDMENRLVLCYTGKPRLSSNLHENVWGAYKRGVRECLDALYTLRDTANRMREALLEGDVAEFGELMNRNWACQKNLDPSISNQQIEDLFKRAWDAGAVAGKACGAGGGGCILFLAAPGCRDDVAEALRKAGGSIIDFRFEFNGLTVEEI